MATKRQEQLASARKRLKIDESMDIKELRTLLGDFKKEVLQHIPLVEFEGTVQEVVKRLKEFPDDTVIKYQSSRYKTSSPYTLIPAGFKIVSYREYTDAELKKEGLKLLEQKKRREATAEKKRKADIKKFNEIARRLGQPTVEEIEK